MNKEESKNETYKTKFRMLAIVLMMQTILLFYVFSTGVVYHFSILESILVAGIVIIFYMLVFAKRHIKVLIDKALDW